jgi:hypothetical protein
MPASYFPGFPCHPEERSDEGLTYHQDTPHLKKILRLRFALAQDNKPFSNKKPIGL